MSVASPSEDKLTKLLAEQNALHVQKHRKKTDKVKLAEVTKRLQQVNHEIATERARRRGLLVESHRADAARIHETYTQTRVQLDNLFHNLELHKEAVDTLEAVDHQEEQR